MKKKGRYILIAVIGVFVLVCEVLTFLYLDKYNYLHKGVSVREYSILPFNTKIQGDRNTSGFYYFTPTRKNGLRVETTTVFSNNLQLTTPTIVHNVSNNKQDTVFLSRIIEYGYNENDIVIRASTMHNTVVLLKPVWKGNRIYLIEENDLDESIYNWIIPQSGSASNAMIVWILLLAIIPLSIIIELCLIFHCVYDGND